MIRTAMFAATVSVMTVVSSMNSFAGEALDWPSDFWTHVTNSMALPSGTQIAESTGKVLSYSASGDTAFSYAVGSENEPFDSRWRTFGISNSSSVDSRPCGMVLTVR